MAHNPNSDGNQHGAENLISAANESNAKKVTLIRESL